MHFEKKANRYTINMCTIVWNVFLKTLNQELGQRHKHRLHQIKKNNYYNATII